MLAWILFVVGIWAAVSGFIPPLVRQANFLATGIVVLILGVLRPRKGWQDLVIGFLGIWLILSSFVQGLMTPVNLILCGFLVFLYSLRALFVPGLKRNSK